jgi:hypothetical protein
MAGDAQDFALAIGTVVFTIIYSWCTLSVVFVRPCRLSSGVLYSAITNYEKAIVCVHLLLVWITEVLGILWILVIHGDHVFTYGAVFIWVTVLLVGTKDAIDALLSSKSYRAAEHIWASITCVGTGAVCMSIGIAFTDGIAIPLPCSAALGIFSFGFGREWYPRCRRRLEQAWLGAVEEPIQMIEDVGPGGQEAEE